MVNLLKTIIQLEWMNYMIYKIYLSKVRGGKAEGVMGRRETHKER